jgi:hypothetical protein
LATYLYQSTGIAVKRTAMRVFCQRHDIRPYRPTYRYIITAEKVGQNHR